MKTKLARALALAVAAAPIAADAAPPTPTAPSVRNAVERYRVPLGAAPVRGPETAKVTILEFVDYECPFSARAEATTKQIFETYGSDVRLQVLQRPFLEHRRAAPAARAALAAALQGKFWQMHEILFANQAKLGDKDLERYAAQIGLDVPRFRADLAGEAATRLEVDQATASSVRVTATPVFFVNGRMLTGNLPFERFKAIIDEELRVVDALLARGVEPRDLYNELTKDGIDQVPLPSKRTPRLGMVVQDLEPGHLRALGLPPTTKGLVVGQLQAGPADRAGLKTGDAILALDGKVGPTPKEFVETVLRKQRQPMVLRVASKSGEKTVTLTPE